MTVTNRFFWLPWQSVHAATVGPYTRWTENPNYNNPYPLNTYGWAYNKGRWGSGTTPERGNYYNEVLETNQMRVFPVTTDVNRVPLDVTTVDFVTPLSNTGGDYPQQPSYRYWNGMELRVAAYFQTTMNDPVPDRAYDDRGPIEYLTFSVPVAKSVYEMTGVTSINGNQFCCVGYQQYQKINPIWIRNSIGSQTTVFGRYTPTGYGPFNTMGWEYASIQPFCIYVQRPSTGAIVGWIAFDPFRTDVGRMNYSGDPAYLPSQIFELHVQQGTYTYGTVGNVSGIQNGDLIVWEWWAFLSGSTWSFSDAQVPRPKVTQWRSHVRTHWGGGLPGQPLTFSGVTGLPNWAPAHRSETTTAITGIEPVEAITYSPTATANARIVYSVRGFEYPSDGGAQGLAGELTVQRDDISMEVSPEKSPSVEVSGGGGPSVEVIQ